MSSTAISQPRSSRSEEYSEKQIKLLLREPHRLGWICGKDLLQPIHSEWIKYCWDDPVLVDQDSALQAHRGSYKTTAIDVIGTIRWLMSHPNDRIAIVRKTFSDAAEVVDTVAAIMRKPEVKLIFKACGYGIPKAIIERSGKLTYNFKETVTPEANVTAHGLDGSLTGHHYDKIICDDIITLKDRISHAEREQTKEMIRELATNIIDPGKHVAWIGTPWHRDDGWTTIPITPIKYSIHDCEILSPREIEKKKRTTTPFLFAANYELNVTTDESSLFKDAQMGSWDYALSSVAHLDAAFDGDHTCALTVMSRIAEGKIQAKGWVYPGNVKDWLGEIAKFCKQHKVKILYNETNPDKGYTADALLKLGLSVYTYAEKQNKHMKIATHLYEAWGSLVWDKDTDPEYLNQILDYREGMEPDDAPDSAASLVREALPVKAVTDSMWRF